MKIILQVNPQYSFAQTALQSELEALGPVGVKVTAETTKPTGLAWGEITQFIIAHKEEIGTGGAFVVAIIRIVKQWLRRSKKSDEESTRKLDEKPIIIVVNNHRIGLPASEPSERKFLSKVIGDSGPDKLKKAKKPSGRTKSARNKSAKSRSRRGNGGRR